VSILPTSIETKNDASRSTFTLTEGVWIAVASSFAYLITFQYEKGFASHWGVPPQFVTVGFVNVLYAAVLVTGFVFFAALLLNFILQLAPPRVFEHPVVSKRFIDIAYGSLITLAAAYFFNSKFWWILFISGTALLVFFAFVVPIFLNRGVTGYLNKIEAHENKIRTNSAPPSMSVFRLAARRLGPNLPIVLWWSLFAVFIAESAGDSAAANQKQFLVTMIAHRQARW